MPLRCVIVDDSPSFSEIARVLLERGGLVVEGVASTSAEALRLSEDARPAVALVDIMLGAESGFELARMLAEMPHCAPAVILISTHSEADFADLIAQSPSIGFLTKSELSADEVRRIFYRAPRRGRSAGATSPRGR